MQNVQEIEYYTKFISRLTEHDLIELFTYCLNQGTLESNSSDSIPERVTIEELPNGVALDDCIFAKVHWDEDRYCTYYISDFTLIHGWATRDPHKGKVLQEYLTLKFGDEYLTHLHDKMVNDATERYIELKNKSEDNKSLESVNRLILRFKSKY